MAANLRAVEADKRQLARAPTRFSIYTGYVVHNLEFCAWAAMYACGESPRPSHASSTPPLSTPPPFTPPPCTPPPFTPPPFTPLCRYAGCRETALSAAADLEVFLDESKLRAAPMLASFFEAYAAHRPISAPTSAPFSV